MPCDKCSHDCTTKRGIRVEIADAVGKRGEYSEIARKYGVSRQYVYKLRVEMSNAER